MTVVKWIIPPDIEYIPGNITIAPDHSNIYDPQFPASPNINDVHKWWGRYYRWTGSNWEIAVRIIVDREVVNTGGGGTGSGIVSVVQDFTNASLNGLGQLVINHYAGTTPLSFELLDEEGQPVLVNYDSINNNNSVLIDLKAFQPINGVWKVSLLFPPV